ncbi:MAG: hypothetical protein PHX05_06270, partial [Acidobacteriota bacterium]|nr:hypothetical protein [Acidobacteriota bacterium]
LLDDVIRSPAFLPLGFVGHLNPIDRPKYEILKIAPITVFGGNASGMTNLDLLQVFINGHPLNPSYLSLSDIEINCGKWRNYCQTGRSPFDA